MDSSRKRDQSIERLLRQSLKTPQNGGVTDSCLDAETLAAMLDGGLSGATLEMAESHLADCARCQSVSGALARLEADVQPTEPRHAVRGWLAWVVPLAAAAAAVAVWVAVPNHSGPQLPQTTKIESQTAETPALQPAARADRSQIPASGNVGEPSARTPVPEAAAKKQPELARELRRDATPSEASKSVISSASDAQSPASANAGAAPTAGAVPNAGAVPSAAAPAGALGGAVPSTAARAPSPSSANTLDSLRSTVRRAEVAAVEIVSPDPMVRWRITGSIVQRSTDGGAGWETQSIGTAMGLTAGSAPSTLVCWIVGRGGVVLLSADGHSWRGVAFPEMTDLSAVRARDARSASVSTADGRTFSTTDAGATWAPRPLQDF